MRRIVVLVAPGPDPLVAVRHLAGTAPQAGRDIVVASVAERIPLTFELAPGLIPGLAPGHALPVALELEAARDDALRADVAAGVDLLEASGHAARGMAFAGPLRSALRRIADLLDPDLVVACVPPRSRIARRLLGDPWAAAAVHADTPILVVRPDRPVPQSLLAVMDTPRSGAAVIRALATAPLHPDAHAVVLTTLPGAGRLSARRERQRTIRRLDAATSMLRRAGMRTLPLVRTDSRPAALARTVASLGVDLVALNAGDGARDRQLRETHAQVDAAGCAVLHVPGAVRRRRPPNLRAASSTGAPVVRVRPPGY